MIVTAAIRKHQHGGRLTAGYAVILNGAPVYAGTFSECCGHGDTLPRGAAWVIRDARGLAVPRADVTAPG